MKNRLFLVLTLLLCFGINFTYAEENNEFKNFTVKKELLRKYKNRSGLLSPILEGIWKMLKDKVLEEANNITDGILEHNQKFDLGDKNFSGFKWSQLYGNVKLNAGRRLDPDFNQEDLWIVTDRFEIEINATTFLQSLIDDGDLEMKKSDMKLFSGIVFKRVYTHTHYASSYLKGLKSDFKKLFFPFLRFHKKNYLSLDPHESITKNDYLSAKVEGSIESPSVYYVSAYGKVVLQYEKIGALKVHRPGERDFPREDEFLRISIQKESVKSGSLQVGAQADFFKLLKLTLFSREFNYQIMERHSTNLSFNNSEIEMLEGNTELADEMKKVIKGKLPNNDLVFMPFLISEEEGRVQSLSYRGQNLLWGKSIGNTTEDVIVRTKQGTRYFFRHNSERSTLSKGALQYAMDSKSFKKYKIRQVENISFEYELLDSQRRIPFNELELENSSDVSIRFSKEFYVKKTTGWWYRNYRKKAVRFVRQYTDLGEDVAKAIEDERLFGEITLNINAQIGAKGLPYLVNLTNQDLEDGSYLVCLGKLKKHVSKLKRKNKKCLKQVIKSYNKFKSEFNEKDRYVLWKLKSFLHDLSSKTTNLKPLKVFFGEENIHFAGTIKSNDEDGFNFKTFMLEGWNQGKGLIMDYLKKLWQNRSLN